MASQCQQDQHRDHSVRCFLAGLVRHRGSPISSSSNHWLIGSTTALGTFSPPMISGRSSPASCLLINVARCFCADSPSTTLRRLPFGSWCSYCGVMRTSSIRSGSRYRADGGDGCSSSTAAGAFVAGLSGGGPPGLRRGGHRIQAVIGRGRAVDIAARHDDPALRWISWLIRR